MQGAKTSTSSRSPSGYNQHSAHIKGWSKEPCRSISCRNASSKKYVMDMRKSAAFFKDLVFTSQNKKYKKAVLPTSRVKFVTGNLAMPRNYKCTDGQNTALCRWNASSCLDRYVQVVGSISGLLKEFSNIYATPGLQVTVASRDCEGRKLLWLHRPSLRSQMTSNIFIAFLQYKPNYRWTQMDPPGLILSLAEKRKNGNKNGPVLGCHWTGQMISGNRLVNGSAKLRWHGDKETQQKPWISLTIGRKPWRIFKGRLRVKIWWQCGSLRNGFSKSFQQSSRNGKTRMTYRKLTTKRMTSSPRCRSTSSSYEKNVLVEESLEHPTCYPPRSQPRDLQEDWASLRTTSRRTTFWWTCLHPSWPNRLLIPSSRWLWGHEAKRTARHVTYLHLVTAATDGLVRCAASSFCGALQIAPYVSWSNWELAICYISIATSWSFMYPSGGGYRYWNILQIPTRRANAAHGNRVSINTMPRVS